jgi:putative sterol carrier protein
MNSMTARNTIGRTRRRLRGAEASAGDRLARLAQRAPAGGLDLLMRSPARKLVVGAIFQQMPRRIERTRAAGLSAVIRWQISSTQADVPDVYDLVLEDGRARIARPLAGAPDARLTFTMTAAELLAIATGASDPMQAYFKGRIKIGGDIMLAAKLASLFRMPGRAGRSSR